LFFFKHNSPLKFALTINKNNWALFLNYFKAAL